MKCSMCSNKAVHNDLCKSHFIEYYEKKVSKTITDFNLVPKKAKVMVATSGGKDSLCVLYMLKKIAGKVVAIAVDEGIKGYREHSLKDLKIFCKEHKVELKLYSFKEEFGKTLDQLYKELNMKPCTICGVLRRHILNKYSRNFDIIATGHNLDDECQSIVMNYLRFNLELMARLGPKTGLIESKKFVPRIKPLYFCTEKENMVFSLLKRFQVKFVECPYAIESYRATIREELNLIENLNPGTKKNIVEGFILTMDKFKKHFSSENTINSCSLCGEPSKNKICKTCTIIKKIR